MYSTGVDLKPTATESEGFGLIHRHNRLHGQKSHGFRYDHESSTYKKCLFGAAKTDTN